MGNNALYSSLKAQLGLCSSINIPESKPIKLIGILKVEQGECDCMQLPSCLMTFPCSVTKKHLVSAKATLLLIANAALSHKIVFFILFITLLLNRIDTCMRILSK